MAGSQPIIFTHIQKTAGTTIHAAANRVVGPGAWFTVRNNDDVDVLRTMPEEKRSKLRYIGGHIDFPSAFDIFPEATFVTALREPVERTLSHYFFLLREIGFELDPEQDNAVVEGFRRFYADDSGDRARNFQCRMICGEADHVAALDILRNHYALVWDSAETTHVWPALNRLLSQKTFFDIEEEAYVAPVAKTADDLAAGARPRDYASFLREDLRARVMQDNAEDVALYAKLVAESEGGVLRRH